MENILRIYAKGKASLPNMECSMKYRWTYTTPDGFDDIVMCGDCESLTALLFKVPDNDSRVGEGEWRDTPAFQEARRWLDAYFSGRDPGFVPRHRLEGLTPFRQEVVDEMVKIPFGSTASYGDIAKAISARHGGRKVSARAVGGAVGWNPLCIVVPCHRVIGANGSLTGYGGGIRNKIALLAHESSKATGGLASRGVG